MECTYVNHARASTGISVDIYKAHAYVCVCVCVCASSPRSTSRTVWYPTRGELASYLSLSSKQKQVLHR